MKEFTATYSPDDNKLRIYSVSRLDAETYAKVKPAGYAWAPKQGFFVAPAWTPQREDVALELAGEIDDEDSTLVERAEERAERFEDYTTKRAREAASASAGVDRIAQGIPFGQPILVGHHSEKRARKDAERIENGMRKACKLWDTAQYWQERAAGAIMHAKYKERPDVRHRRIKGLESELRKFTKNKEDGEKLAKLWAVCDNREKALTLANFSHHYRCWPIDQYPRPEGASTYEGERSVWSVLDENIITWEQARDILKPSYERGAAHNARWIAHTENRLAYERAMLAEALGVEVGQDNGSRYEFQIGGAVNIRWGWARIIRINRKDGKVVSLSTTEGVRGIEEVKDYRPPTEEETQYAERVTKVLPLCNYPGEDAQEMTQAEYKARHHYVARIKATETTGAHRMRQVSVGACRYKRVYLTDVKRTDPPPAAKAAPVELPPLPPKTPRYAPTPDTPKEPEPWEKAQAIKDALKTGVQVVSAPQLFPTPKEIARQMVEAVYPKCAGARILEPSAGTGRLIEAAFNQATGADNCKVVAVEVNPQLAEGLRQMRQRWLYATEENFDVRCSDFLDLTPDDLGLFHVILMNPPFKDGQDIKHIKHATQFLKPRGVLVALCAAGPRQFAELQPLADHWETLPPGSFEESGTGVNVSMMIIRRPKETPEPPQEEIVTAHFVTAYDTDPSKPLVLLGPFDTAAEAQDHEDTARRLMTQAEPLAVFWAYEVRQYDPREVITRFSRPVRQMEMAI